MRFGVWGILGHILIIFSQEKAIRRCNSTDDRSEKGLVEKEIDVAMAIDAILNTFSSLLSFLPGPSPFLLTPAS